MKHRLCNECYAATGHAEWCVSKGYAGVGPHPDAPPDTARAPVRATPPAQCPCGRVDCEYHAGASAPAYEVYDAYAGHKTGQHATCKCRACTYLRVMS